MSCAPWPLNLLVDEKRRSAFWRDQPERTAWLSPIAPLTAPPNQYRLAASRLLAPVWLSCRPMLSVI